MSKSLVAALGWEDLSCDAFMLRRGFLLDVFSMRGHKVGLSSVSLAKSRLRILPRERPVSWFPGLFGLLLLEP